MTTLSRKDAAMTFDAKFAIVKSRSDIRGPLMQSTVTPAQAWDRSDTGFAEYDNIDISIDSSIRTVWCYMNTKKKPIVTQALLDDLRHMQNALPGVYSNCIAEGKQPLTHFVFASRTPDVYSLGGDLKFFAESFRSGDRSRIHHYARTCIDVIHQNINAFDLPMVSIALVQGAALGGGFETALSFDMIIAEKSSKMGLPEILFNLFPGMGAYSLLSRRLSPAQAQKMILSGRIYTAEELYDMGVVDVLADDGCGEAAAADYIQRNASKFNAHRAFYQTRRRVNPITYDELSDVVDSWTDAVFQLSDADIGKMTRLIAAQDRRFKANEPAMAGR
jgi:DSF synthase